MGDESSNPAGRFKLNRFRLFAGFSSVSTNGNSTGEERIGVPTRRGFGAEARFGSESALPDQRTGWCQERQRLLRPRRARARRAPSSLHPSRRSEPRPHRRRRRRTRARSAAGRDRNIRRAPGQLRTQGGRVESHPTDGVDEREPVGPGCDDGPGGLCDVPRGRRKLRVERLGRASPGRPPRSAPSSPAPPRRSDRRG